MNLACVDCRESSVLGEPMSAFQSKSFGAVPPGPQASKREFDIYTFRSRAAEAIGELYRALSRFSAPVKKALVKAEGGCS